MPVSRSGPIRKAIGPRKAKLLTLIKTCQTLNRDIAASNLEDDIAKRELVIEAEELIAKLETCIEGLRESDKQWQDLIENLAPEEVDDEDAIYQEFVDAADNHVVTIDEGRENLSLLRVTLARPQTNSKKKPEESTANSSQSNARKGGASKLPKLILPQFDGEDVLMWSQFWAIFEANINETDLRGVEKLTYLRGQLTGNALTTIEGLEITDGNYQVAVDLLKVRFKRSPEKVISTLYSQLKRIPTSSNKVEDLQRTFDICERLFRQLKTEGEDVDKNRSLVMDVMSKYPPEVLTEMSRRHPTNELSTVGKAQTAFREYIEEARSLQGMLTDLEPFGTSTKSKHKPQGFHSLTPKSDEPISSALTTTGSTSKSSASPKSSSGNAVVSPCYFCGNAHFNSQCTVYATTDEREKRLDELQRCRRCLTNTHVVADCRTRPQRIRCFFCDKTGHHVSPLCPGQFSNNSTAVKLSSGQAKDTTPKTSSSLCLEEQSVLSTAMADIVNPSSGYKRRIRIIMDSGSHRSYITAQLAGELNLSSDKAESLNVAVFGSKRSLNVQTRRVGVSLCLRDGWIMSISAHTTPIITNCSLSPGQLSTATRELISTFKDAMADDFEAEPGPPDLLIGSDYFWELVTGACIRLEDGIHLIPSKFGLILGGRFVDDNYNSPGELPSLLCVTERQPTEVTVTESSSSSSCLFSSRDGNVVPDVDEFWSMERIGISDNPVENDDTVAQQRFDETVSFKNGRYHVSWPWKRLMPQLPTNYQLALGRFKSLAQRLTRSDNQVFTEYSKVIADQLSRCIIEEVPTSERWSTDNPVHYLPHHPVIRVNSDTTKVRVVYDASAKARKDQPCLNECLYRGPVILPNLCSILLRFRLHNVAMVADIEKAFLQLGLNEEDRDVTRFLWFEDYDNPDVNRTTVYRFTRVCFGVISSPFLLGATVYFHLTKQNTTVAIQIRDNTYVDNAIFGATDEKAGLAAYREAKEIFNGAGMNLREWTTSSEELNSTIAAADRASKREVKVLGLVWDHVSDTIALQTNWEKYKLCKTKREVLQAVASFYDPLGLFQPCIHAAKCFLRDMWKRNFQWDDPLPDQLQLSWITLHEDLGSVFNIKTPRHIHVSSIRTLVAFADASGDAYATAIYLRTQNESENWVSTLVFSKSRLAPRNSSALEISLPRLELLGLLIAVRAVQFVRTSISPLVPLPAFILSDSSCVLGWIRSEKPLPVFVSNRVEEIRKIEHTEFHHVGTLDNPADLATRGKTGDEIANSKLWWHGPSWLQQNSNHWPTKSIITPISSSELQDIGQKCGPDTFTLVAGPPDANIPWRPLGMDPASYSSIQKVLRVTAICLKFLLKRVWSRLDTNIQRDPYLQRIFSSISEETYVTGDELKVTRILWAKSSQLIRYSDVITAIQQSKRHYLIKQLDLFIDSEGLIRCGGRMLHADLPEEAIQPILIPKDDEITSLLIRECHAKLLHCGISHTLSQLRRIYWIPQGRNAVRKILNRCLMCRKFKGAPFALPKMPPWPRQRVARAIPFQYTGLDYLGPITISVHGTSYKMWVCLFTCLTVRAVHLEPVIDCTAQSFIECLSRFISGRGCTEEIISDNAPQFRLAKNLLDRTWHKVLIDDAVTSYISNRGVKWKFTTELAPWQGGVYERLVGVVKGVLRVGIGRQRLEWSQFSTLLAEVEAIVNSRPITYVHSDQESGSALRPIDFISELPTGFPEINLNEKPTGGDAGKQLIRSWKMKQRKLDNIWIKWYDDYLLSMRERGQLCHKTGRRDIHAIPAVDDVVLVKDTDVPRGLWKLGIIIKLLPSGETSIIRSAELRLPNGQIIRRPLNHLYQLELPVSVSAGEEGTQDEQSFEGFDETEVVAAEERVQELRRVLGHGVDSDHSTDSTSAVLNQLQRGLNRTAVTCRSVALNNYSTIRRYLIPHTTMRRYLLIPFI